MVLVNTTSRVLTHDELLLGGRRTGSLPHHHAPSFSMCAKQEQHELSREIHARSVVLSWTPVHPPLCDRERAGLKAVPCKGGGRKRKKKKKKGNWRKKKGGRTPFRNKRNQPRSAWQPNECGEQHEDDGACSTHARTQAAERCRRVLWWLPLHHVQLSYERQRCGHCLFYSCASQSKNGATLLGYITY